MTTSEPASLEPYRFRTRNVREGENRVHSPEEARERGEVAAVPARASDDSLSG